MPAASMRRPCAARGVEIDETPNCFTASYTVRHQATWETWAAKSGLKENRTRAEVAAAIRQPVEQAYRQALRPARWEQSRPLQRLVA